MYIPPVALALLGSLSQLLRKPSYPKHVTYRLNNGAVLPAPAFGVGSVIKFSNVTDNVMLALDVGYRHIDNAAFYKTEETAGDGLIASGVPRENIYVTSKFDRMHGVDNVRAEVFSSLEKLKVDYLDLYLIHGLFAVQNITRVWQEMESLVDSGYIRTIGVSNYDAEHIAEILSFARIPPAVNQIRYHAYNARSNAETVEFCIKHNILVEAYSSLTPITSMPGGPVDVVAERIAKRLSKTAGTEVSVSNMVFSWLRSKGIAAVTTSSKRERLENMLLPFQHDFPYKLTPEEIGAYEAYDGWMPKTETGDL